MTAMWEPRSRAVASLQELAAAFHAIAPDMHASSCSTASRAEQPGATCWAGKWHSFPSARL